MSIAKERLNPPKGNPDSSQLQNVLIRRSTPKRKAPDVPQSVKPYTSVINISPEDVAKNQQQRQRQSLPHISRDNARVKRQAPPVPNSRTNEKVFDDDIGGQTGSASTGSSKAAIRRRHTVHSTKEFETQQFSVFFQDPPDTGSLRRNISPDRSEATSSVINVNKCIDPSTLNENVSFLSLPFNTWEDVA